MLCTCDPGWSGASCEYDLGMLLSSLYSFVILTMCFIEGTATNNLLDISNYDLRPNGWGNPTTTYLYANTVLVSGGGVRFALTNSGCPNSMLYLLFLLCFILFIFLVDCGATPYSSGAWEYVPRYTYGSFSFTAQPSNVIGKLIFKLPSSLRNMNPLY